MPKKNSKNSSKANNKKSKKESDVDWITALAKESSTAASDKSIQVLSKKERIEKRNAKKRRREERKGASNTNSVQKHSNQEAEADPEELRVKAEYYMNKLSQKVQGIISRIDEGKSYKERRHAKPFAPTREKGKATSGQQLSDDIIQPRKRDYGGLGLARPSLLLNLRDLSFIPKLEEEFAEHVPGFFGKQRTKAMKKQLDGDMLWRRLADKSGKAKGKGKKQDLNVKVNGKKLSDMTPDERVEAMIRLDMI